MKLNTYLHFEGQCREAFAFYQQVLGGQIPMTMTYGESPMGADCGADMQNKIMHTRLQVGDQVLMGSDSPPQYQCKPQGFTVSIVVDDVAEGKRLFTALAEGGTVQMPYEKTFWAEGFGMATDKFGIPWMVNCETPR